MTYYNPMDKTVSFQIYDLTTNKLATLGPWSTIIDTTGHVKGLTSDYYDGFGYDSDGDPFPGYEYVGWAPVIMQNDDNAKNLSVPTGFPISGATMWQNTWKACS